jgi:hypothetical protein
MNVTGEERRRRAYTARQLANMAVCSATKAFFLQLEERWHPVAQWQPDPKGRAMPDGFTGDPQVPTRVVAE